MRTPISKQNIEEKEKEKAITHCSCEGCEQSSKGYAGEKEAEWSLLLIIIMLLTINFFIILRHYLL